MLSSVSRVINTPSRPIEEAPEKALTEKELRKGFRLLLELVISKRRLYIKPRDLMYVLGYSREDAALTLVGKVLSKLSASGLAIRWNNSRPIKYTLTPRELWVRFIEVEVKSGFAFKCESEGGVCSLVGICPYWVLSHYLRGGRSE